MSQIQAILRVLRCKFATAVEKQRLDMQKEKLSTGYLIPNPGCSQTKTWTICSETVFGYSKANYWVYVI